MAANDNDPARQELAQVRAILMSEWDPIGVADREGAEDEYDRYAAKAYAMLMQEVATEQALAEYLLDVVTRYMGLSGTTGQMEACARTAAALVALRTEFKRTTRPPA